ncbi:nuclease-related domain-containing protein [Alteribacillus iranensis]|uniref:Nuclease-related domain-containing protein n=1 Tax=Alteribacillus iranensis TaxID=930128 RepID=A0A1I2E7Q6_9BACI|nr:nuclease-related domain-containing protein [Alteribacillus iranensis]SFE88656.1 Nuclease-related domain-containing protein [Alteribacillus iranensis]
MIIKPRKVPLHLRKLRALERRLPHSHPKRPEIERDTAKWSAGYKGEQSIDDPLTFLPPHDFRILHDLHLYDGSHYFQIDTLIISSCFLLIIEVINISGTLIFDTAGFADKPRNFVYSTELFAETWKDIADNERQSVNCSYPPVLW